MTVVADTFCHLYVLAAAAQEDLRRYMRAMRLPLAKRLPADARLPGSSHVDADGRGPIER